MQDIDWNTIESKSPEIEDAPNGREIFETCFELAWTLAEKNAKYGDSALDPERVFSDAGAVEQIDVRIDDKISRIRRSHPEDREDAIRDLAGYLVLRMIATSRTKQED